MNGTDFRIFYEKYGLYKLSEYLNCKPSDIEHISEKDPIYPYDLKYKQLRFDVKFSSPVIYAKGKKSIWDFSLRKVVNGKRIGQDKLYCDYFILIGMMNGIPKKTYIIPSGEAPTNHVRISIKGVSKYQKYEL